MLAGSPSGQTVSEFNPAPQSHQSFTDWARPKLIRSTQIARGRIARTQLRGSLSAGVKTWHVETQPERAGPDDGFASLQCTFASLHRSFHVSVLSVHPSVRGGRAQSDLSARPPALLGFSGHLHCITDAQTAELFSSASPKETLRIRNLAHLVAALLWLSVATPARVGSFLQRSCNVLMRRSTDRLSQRQCRARRARAELCCLRVGDHDAL